jgi:hypothetical protein
LVIKTVPGAGGVGTGAAVVVVAAIVVVVVVVAGIVVSGVVDVVVLAPSAVVVGAGPAVVAGAAPAVVVVAASPPHAAERRAKPTRSAARLRVLLFISDLCRCRYDRLPTGAGISGLLFFAFWHKPLVPADPKQVGLEQRAIEDVP